MRITGRDVKLLKDIALSHALSRDQILDLGYFGSVTRANTRLRELHKEGFVRRINTPFFAQSLYSAGSAASVVLGPRIACLVAPRAPSPRFLQHALCVTNLRIGLIKHEAVEWRFEQQLLTRFDFQGKPFEVRPDGLAVLSNGLVAVEADLGHVAPAKIREKLKAYAAFVASGECALQWQADTFSLLFVTTGKLRASRLSKLVPRDCNFEVECVTFDRLGVAYPGSWS